MGIVGCWSLFFNLHLFPSVIFGDDLDIRSFKGVLQLAQGHGLAIRMPALESADNLALRVGPFIQVVGAKQ